MHRFVYAALLAAPLIFSAAPAANAVGVIVPGTYELLDHGEGELGAFYGLRHDALGEVFSVQLNSVELFLSWDGGVTAKIFGTLNENSSGGGGGVGPTWDLVYDLTGVSAVGTQGFTATAGTGILTDPLNNMTVLTGQQNGDGFAFLFLADGHRLPGDDDTPVGRGWLVGSGTNDFLVKSGFDPIPEPNTLLLLGLGLGGLAVAGRRVPRTS